MNRNHQLPVVMRLGRFCSRENPIVGAAVLVIVPIVSVLMGIVMAIPAWVVLHSLGSETRHYDQWSLMGICAQSPSALEFSEACVLVGVLSVIALYAVFLLVIGCGALGAWCVTTGRAQWEMTRYEV